MTSLLPQGRDIIENKLTRTMTCINFINAVEYIQKIAQLAEIQDHHPDIFLHSYNKVTITLFTHSENKLTEKDYILANQINEAFSD